MSLSFTLFSFCVREPGKCIDGSRSSLHCFIDMRFSIPPFLDHDSKTRDEELYQLHNFLGIYEPEKQPCRMHKRPTMRLQFRVVVCSRSRNDLSQDCAQNFVGVYRLSITTGVMHEAFLVCYHELTKGRLTTSFKKWEPWTTKPQNDMFVQKLCGGVCICYLTCFSLGPFGGIVRSGDDVPIEVGGQTNRADEIYTLVLTKIVKLLQGGGC